MGKNRQTSAPRKLCLSQETWPQLEELITQAMNTSPASGRLQLMSKNIATLFVEIEEPLNELCNLSCTNCSEPCCTKATVWYDLKDLLFIYLTTGTFPDRQVSRNCNGACAQLTPSGCNAGRACRPFICTWYICASQKEIIKSQKSDLPAKDVTATIKVIQSRRKELENIFLRTISN